VTPRLPDPALPLARHAATQASAAALVLLDLDGTLTDSAPGILASVRHAYRALSLPVPDEDRMRGFVGPPMQTSLLGHGVAPEQLDDAMAAYREHYSHAMLEATVYPGVVDALVGLRTALAPGAALVLATSKPEVFAQQIVDHLGLARHLDAVYGASLDESRLSKASVVAHALRSEHERTGRAVVPSRAVMVGDRHHDVTGAGEHGIGCIGVLWGYGSRAELLDAGAVALAPRPADLVPLVRRALRDG